MYKRKRKGNMQEEGFGPHRRGPDAYNKAYTANARGSFNPAAYKARKAGIR